jgi:hypothetical protein
MSRRSPKVRKSESPEDSPGSKVESLKAEDENTSAPDSYRDEHPKRQSPLEHVEKTNNSEKSEIETLQTAPDSYRDSKLQTETMEVHHHPNLHHEKKPWKEYLLEFLMIFLAVTMGFFAENLRETIADNRQTHEYMQSMVSDLESDIALYRSSINFNQQYSDMIDTIVTSFTENKNNKRQVYLMARRITMGSSVIAPNAKTFEQMKSSGAIHLIKSQRIADSIASYYQWVKKFDYWSDLQRQRINDILTVNDKIFDAAIFFSIVKEMANPETTTLNLKHDPKFFSLDPVLVNSVLMRYQYYYGLLSLMNRRAANASSQAMLLIKLLKKEYHLENE